MRTIILSTLTLVALSGVAHAQGATPATPAGAASAAPATASPAAAPAAPRTAQPSVFGAPTAAAGAHAALAVPQNIGTLIQHANSVKVQKCAAKGGGFYWKANARYGQPKADGTPSLTTGSCKARKFGISELTEGGLSPDQINRIIAVDAKRTH